MRRLNSTKLRLKSSERNSRYSLKSFVKLTPNLIPNRSIAHVDGIVNTLQRIININESQLIAE